MTTRRECMAGADAIEVGPGFVGGTLASSPLRSPSGDDLCRWVDPFIGSGGYRHTYPGATMPFGIVQRSPDTNTVGWDACSSYYRDDTTLLGFFHTHLSDAGGPDILDVLVVPCVGPVSLDPSTVKRSKGSYRTSLDAREIVSPGHYSVLLKDMGVEPNLAYGAIDDDRPPSFV